ncbi:MAG: serine hydrolase [Clostridia bacterium]|nr:serine hydrolase [Clostridia bacterium]
MNRKIIALFLCICSILLCFLNACGEDESALVANTTSNGIKLDDEMNDLLSDISSTDLILNTDIEPEYKLTEKEQIIADNAKEYMQQLDFSGTVLIGIGENIIYCDSYNYADKKLKLDNTNDTVYQIASLSKQFTGAAVLLLQEQGKLKVTDKLSKYIDGYKYGDKLTIENLLFMTSGMQDFADAYILDSLKAEKEYPIGYMYDLIKDYDLWSIPGTTYEYCNTNFYVLGMIIEKASGMSYEEYINKYIFEPLNMNSTSLDTSTVNAKGYSWGNEFSCVYDKSIFYSAGAICSNAKDMFKWLNGFYSEKVISRESIDYILSDKSKLGYSCGWVVSQEGIMRHSGNLGGYKTFAMINYQNDIKVVVLSNNEQQSSAEIGLQLNEIAKREI